VAREVVGYNIAEDVAAPDTAELGGRKIDLHDSRLVNACTPERTTSRHAADTTAYGYHMTVCFLC
jgi:hypothetical protein